MLFVCFVCVSLYALCAMCTVVSCLCVCLFVVFIGALSAHVGFCVALSERDVTWIVLLIHGYWWRSMCDVSSLIPA